MFKNILALILALALAFSSASGQTLGAQEQSKLHPRFQELLGAAPLMGLAKASAHTGLSVLQRPDGRGAVAVIIYTDDPEGLESKGVHLNSRFAGFATALVTVEELRALALEPSVMYLDPGNENYPLTDVSLTEIGATALHAGIVNGTPYTGQGAIVLVYDTGIDWAHLDFRNPADTTKTRILAIWDQTLTAVGGEAPPAGFSYGVEYTKVQIEDELDGTPSHVVREQDINGHGTHVMGTAAGNGLASNYRYTGVAPGADLVVVKGGDGSFSEAGMIDGLTYAGNIASSYGKPIVVNWSIGSQVGPHDGTRDYESAIDAFTGVPGRVVTVSGGNEGANPIHIAGTVPGGGTETITLTVPSYTPTPGSYNDRFVLDLWLDGPHPVTATVRTPGAYSYVRNADEWGTAPQTAEGTIYLSNSISPLNGKRNIYLEVYDPESNPPPAMGAWTLEITAAPSSITYDGWLARSSVGALSVTVAGGNTSMTLGMPGTSEGAITVASHVTKWIWKSDNGSTYSYTGADRTGDISTFSSIGPTRDGRQKPDLAAPGQGITAAMSSTSAQSSTRIVPGGKHYLTQGTSMAAPHVAGAAALLLGAQPSLDAFTIKSTLRSTANKDAFTGGAWNPTWGEGKLDILEGMVSTLYSGGQASQSILSYSSAAAYYIQLPSTSGLKYAVRFTAPFDGRVIGMMVFPNGGANGIKGSGSLAVSVAQDASGSVGGIPGTQIGSAVIIPFSQLVGGTWNTIDLTGTQASVTSGSEFHVTMEVAGSPGDTVQLLMDNDAGNRTTRSSGYLSGQWRNFADASYFGTGYNLLVKAVVASVTDVERISETVPLDAELDQNYPNPFNPTTVIRYSVPKTADVRLTVYDLVGRKVTTLVDLRQSPGVYEARWDGTNASGGPASTGVYFYSLETGGNALTRKMVLVK